MHRFCDIAIFFTALRYASAADTVVVRPSVCHTPVLYQNCYKRKITQTTPYDSPGK